MATRSSKITDLSVTNSVGPNDLFYIVQSNTSMAVLGRVVVPSSSFVYVVGEFESNSVIASNNIANVSWFSWSNASYSGVRIWVDMVEGNNRTQGIMYASLDGLANTVGFNFEGISLGNNMIYPDIYGDNNSGNVSLYFSRQSNSVANVTIRMHGKYFIA